MNDGPDDSSLTGKTGLNEGDERMDATYEPEIYDLTTPATFRGDVDWYRRKARESGGPVLELGVGTGRIALALARDGIDVHALDVHPGMLASLRRKLGQERPEVQQRVTPLEDDMRTFRLEQRFPLVIAPFRAILHNLTEDDHRACFERVREHLGPGGRFAFNVFHPSLAFMAQHAGALAGVWRWSSTVPRRDGGWIVRSDANQYDTVLQRVHSLLRYEDYGPDGLLRRTYLHRLELSYLYAADIRRLLGAAGFRSVEIAGGFDGRPFQTEADELVVEATV
jgi:SAM-dependent methyltransferase